MDWLFTDVYSPSTAKNRDALWEELETIRNAWWGGGALGGKGNFNVIRFVHEKFHVGMMNKSMRDFNEFVQIHALRDCHLTNANFTWTNDQESPILCCLDRFLVSNSWEDLYPQFAKEALPKITLDHWSILFSTSRIKFGSSPFRFENMLTLHFSSKIV